MQQQSRTAMMVTASLTSTGPTPSVVVLVMRCDVARDRHGRPYLRLALQAEDARVVEARWWRYPYPPGRRPLVGQVCRVWGIQDHFDGCPQLRVVAMRPDPGLPAAAFVGEARTPLEELRDELADRVGRLTPDLAALVRAVLSGEVGERFRTWPAANARHGAVRHGLLEHSLRVAAIAEALAGAFRGTLTIDADLVSAACFLHDVGKVYTLPELPGTALPEGADLADHVTRGAVLV